MRRQQRGFAFVLTLAILAGLVALLAISASALRVRVREVAQRSELDRARLAAEAGIQRALAELSLVNAGQATTLQDAWAELGGEGSEEFLLSGYSFRLQIVDAAAKVDLNTAPIEQLQRMPFTQEQIDSLLDWREGGNAPRALGAKDDYYGNLPNPYNAGLRRLDSLDQLLTVKGFTARSLYYPQTDVVSTATIIQGSSDQQPTLADLADVDSFSPQTTPTGQTRLNVNNAAVGALVQRGLTVELAAQIIQRRPFNRLGDVVSVAAGNRQMERIIVDELTTSGATRVEGRINLNTASESVLATLPSLQPDIAQALFSRQAQGFLRLSDLLDVPGMTGQALIDTLDRVTVQSSAFWVRIEGRAGRERVWRQALVTLGTDRPRVVRVEEPPFSDMTTRWGWPAEPTLTTTLGEESE